MFEIEFGDEFTRQYPNFSINMQNAIQDFIEIVETHGLGDNTQQYYKGKLSHSWRNLAFDDPLYAYTKNNALWHYHIGIPVYTLSRSGLYYTSDMILHFVWQRNTKKIKIVDYTEHYRANGSFWLPNPIYLT